MTDEQKAAKAAKDKAATDAAKDELTKAEDRVVARYLADQKAKGNTVHPQLPIGAPGSVKPEEHEPKAPK